MQSILQISGPKILVSAILDTDDDLSQYLIQHDADISVQIMAFQDSELEPMPLGAAIQKTKFDFAETLLS